MPTCGCCDVFKNVLELFIIFFVVVVVTTQLFFFTIGVVVCYQGFKELNLSALYTQPNAKQEDSELVEPDSCLQQEFLDADKETSSLRLDEDELCDQVGIWLGHGHHSMKSAPGVGRHVLY